MLLRHRELAGIWVSSLPLDWEWADWHCRHRHRMGLLRGAELVTHKCSQDLDLRCRLQGREVMGRPVVPEAVLLVEDHLQDPDLHQLEALGSRSHRDAKFQILEEVAVRRRLVLLLHLVQHRCRLRHQFR